MPRNLPRARQGRGKALRWVAPVSLVSPCHRSQAHKTNKDWQETRPTLPVKSVQPSRRSPRPGRRVKPAPRVRSTELPAAGPGVSCPRRSFIAPEFRASQGMARVGVETSVSHRSGDLGGALCYCETPGRRHAPMTAPPGLPSSVWQRPAGPPRPGARVLGRFGLLLSLVIVAVAVHSSPTSTIRPRNLSFWGHSGPWWCCKCLSERGQVARKRL